MPQNTTGDCQGMRQGWQSNMKNETIPELRAPRVRFSRRVGEDHAGSASNKEESDNE